MAGTRGIARFRGEQLNNKLLRDQHFDEANKIAEKYIDLQFHNHREILEDTKIDVFVQVNEKAVAGSTQLDVSGDIGTRTVSTGDKVEGVVLTEKVQLRATGTDSPIGDSDSDVVYGRLEESKGSYLLKFYSVEGGKEQPYTFDAKAGKIDYRFVIRTNLSVIPPDAIIQGGSGFVEGATDAKAYMNLIQLMKDVYGSTGTLDNDGNSNLEVSIQDQLSQEVQDRKDADQAIQDRLASATGAQLIGVATDPNYSGVTLQAALSNVAKRLKSSEELMNGISDRDADSASGYFKAGAFGNAEGRILDLEKAADAAFKALSVKVGTIEAADEEEVFEAVGGETEYTLKKGKAKDKTVRLAINGQLQTPGINFTYIKDEGGLITGFNFTPDTLKIVEDVPDVLFIQYKKAE
ncbi:hypothetical protein HPL003_14980 [Paenibacillus terrae HPL-003]|uniref:Uncharacterized protein n=1 Tax=Paenibacillus terrae (strain HPL-003) TaxID=985665 RepID=G7W4A9_PAETH|nr:hypothetical protein [Paenibacillus terrae]AET59747.1 hypothetical protein HPL003_14980 [Paenibacillus terrae HPL-003]